MNTEMLDQLRTKLLNRRDVSLARRWRLLSERDDLRHGEPAVRDRAGRAEAARLSGLAHMETEALARIDASLDRMQHGTYGRCAVCRGAIETERLRAMPDVLRCSGCTH